MSVQGVLLLRLGAHTSTLSGTPLAVPDALEDAEVRFEDGEDCIRLGERSSLFSGERYCSSLGSVAET